MEQRALASEFAQLRLPRLQQPTDRLLRFRAPVAMDQLVNDFNTALDETAGSTGSAHRALVSRRKAWKRRCKSTSNLLLVGQNVSDDSSSSVDTVGLLSRDRGTSSLQFSDSDIESLGPPALARPKDGRSRDKARLSEHRSKRSVTMQGGAGPECAESDSFNENVSPFKEFRAASKRKRKFKRMAVDGSPEPRKPRMLLRPAGGQAGPHTGPPGARRKKVRSRSGHPEPGRRGAVVTPGKRKRSAREKSVDSSAASGEVAVGGRSRTVSLGEEGTATPGAERMELEEADNSSSLSSSSEWEDPHSSSGPEGEADDEHSDWPGPEPGLSVMQLTDEEIDPEISFSQLLAGPSARKRGEGRPVRSGTRRLRPQPGPGGPPHQPPVAYSDQVSRFIQDAARTALRLPAVRAEDRNMVLNLASLYSLSWSPEGPSVLLLTKTGQTVRPEFAVPGIPPAGGPRGAGQQLRERKPTDIKRQRRTPPLSLCIQGPGPGGKGDRQPSGSKARSRAGSRHASGSMSS